MRINTVTKLNLESRAIDLKAAGNSFEKIAEILSKESKEKITTTSVFRFFQSNDIAAARAIEKNDKLKAKVTDAEISTITKRVEIIDKFLDIAEQARECGDFKAAIMALKGATEAQDSLDSRLGKLKDAAGPNVNIFNVQEAANGARAALTSRISSISASFEEIRDIE